MTSERNLIHLAPVLRNRRLLRIVTAGRFKALEPPPHGGRLAELFEFRISSSTDSDGDGASNGLELGDPEGLWVVGDANPENPFNPGDPQSTPPLPEPEPTAVAASSWAQIKALIGE